MGISLNGLTPAGTYPGLIKTGDNTAISGIPKVLSDGNGNDLPMEVSTTGVNFTNNLTQGGTALQPVLVSGTNIKTINGASLLGSGNIPVVTSPSGVSGAIQFSDGSAFSSDATKFFWDNTNKRLGVGTNAPTASIHASQSFGASAISQLDRFGLFINYTSASFGIAIGGSSTTGAGCVQGTNQTGNATGKLSLNPIGGNVAVGQVGSGTGLAMLEVRGSGSTSATTALLVQNSAGTAALTVKDNLDATFNSALNCLGNFYGQGFVFGPNFYITPQGFTTIGVGSLADASSVLDVRSTTRGFLPPRMTTTQKNAIVSPAAGLVLYDTTTNKLQCYNGSTWNDLF
jgi:hypothetical protein